MWPARRARRAAALLAGALAGLAGPAAPAQTGPPFLPLGAGPPVVTLDQERLFLDSAFGRRVAASVEAAARDLAAENRRLEAALTAEERALTERRPAMAPEDFRALADAFDSRVEAIRARQEGRSRAIAEYREAERLRFFELVLPVVAQVVAEAGALVVLDTRAILLAVDDIDITDRVLASADALLGDGADDAPAAPRPQSPPLAPTGPRPPMPRPALPDGGPPLDLPDPPAVE